jgi:phycobilisome rod-core linker protein
MKIPLKKYKPTTQNIRVCNFGSTDPANENEYTPTNYQIEDFSTSFEQVLQAAYYQVFSEEETLVFNRQADLEFQLQNRQITVREFIRGLAKSDRFYELVVSTNNNYRLVEICFKRLLGRTPYNQDEKIAWSVKTSTLGFHGFIDTIIDSEEYTQAFGDNTVPYQRKRMGRPLFVLETPRYDQEYYKKELAVTGHPDWQFIMEKFPNYQQPEQEQTATQVAPDEANPNENRVSTPKVGDLDVDYLLRKWLP